MIEILRDPVRLAFALLGPVVLMIIFGYGITFDVENLPFAVFDRDQSAESRQFVESFAGSRYFEQKTADAQRRGDRPAPAHRANCASPSTSRPRFGRDLLSGHQPEVAFLLDGAMPFRAETARGYVEGIVTVLRAGLRPAHGAGMPHRRTRSRSKRGSATIRNSEAPSRSRPAAS